jgi:hypothetical protein
MGILEVVDYPGYNRTYVLKTVANTTTYEIESYLELAEKFIVGRKYIGTNGTVAIYLGNHRAEYLPCELWPKGEKNGYMTEGWTLLDDFKVGDLVSNGNGFGHVTTVDTSFGGGGCLEKVHLKVKMYNGSYSSNCAKHYTKIDPDKEFPIGVWIRTKWNPHVKITGKRDKYYNVLTLSTSWEESLAAKDDKAWKLCNLEEVKVAEKLLNS